MRSFTSVVPVLAGLLFNLSQLSFANAAYGSYGNSTGNSTGLCCSELSSALGSSKIAYPNSTSYEHSATTYYAKQEGQLAPYCYVLPETNTDVACIVKILARLNKGADICPFAVRSGGHHTVVGIANIHTGVTIDLGNMNKTIVSEDKSIASVDSGARWHSVYPVVVAEGLGVLGGRVSDLGVGGWTTGGGVSYFGALYGFGCDMVANFEVVLANGEIANANSEENPDLFFALKGGSNNFGVVTRFDLKTFPLGDYFGGNNIFLGAEVPALLDAFSAFVLNPDFDPKASLILTPLYHGTFGQLATAIMAYTEPIVNPPVFVNFTTNIPNIQSGTQIANLTYFADNLGNMSPNNLRQTSITATVKPNPELLQKIYALYTATVPLIAPASDLIYSFTFQPLPLGMTHATEYNGPNTLGLDSSETPLVLLALTTQYSSAASDGIIESTTRELFQNIESLARETDDFVGWKFLNYADVTQDVIGGYGEDNAARLREVSKRVDPKGFFQTTQPGGFKLF